MATDGGWGALSPTGRRWNFFACPPHRAISSVSLYLLRPRLPSLLRLADEPQNLRPSSSRVEPDQKYSTASKDTRHLNDSYQLDVLDLISAGNCVDQICGRFYLRWGHYFSYTNPYF